MNPSFIAAISDLVFIERKGLFTHPDVVLFHPGHFPELNKAIADLYSHEGFKKIMIPSLYNPFLDANEHDYHKRILLDCGIPEEKILPILGGHQTVNDVVRSAVSLLPMGDCTVLLAGKAFFCRRFALLASQYAGEHITFDVYPMVDERGINKATWHHSEKGSQRVLNEVKQYTSIVASFQS